MDCKNVILAAFLVTSFCVKTETFIEEAPVVNKKKKLSKSKKKEKIAEELKELARDITYEMKQLVEAQALVIDRLDELVNNDTDGVFSSASDVLLEKSITQLESLRAQNKKRREHLKEQYNFLKDTCGRI